MNRLKNISENKVKQVQVKFKRFLFEKIDWKLPLTIIKGPRGSGKTTLLLQAMKKFTKLYPHAIYVSLDDPYFEAVSLIDFVDAFYTNGGRHIFLDEIHKYKNWARDLKVIFDAYHDLKVVATGSSILEITKSEGDLSRRAAIYRLQGMSLREYINYKNGMTINPLSLIDIINRHYEIAGDLGKAIKIDTELIKYMQTGYYPFFIESEEQYSSRLVRIINQVVENDIPSFEDIDYQTIRNLKKLFYILTQMVPYKPNISELAEKIGTTRNHLLKMLDLLSEASVILMLQNAAKGLSKLVKPEKIYLHNTNINYALSDNSPDIGQLRETFFMNQVGMLHHISAPKFGDFMVDDTYIFEVGGPNKSLQQISGMPNAYLVIDRIIQGSNKRIPLWVFGMLY